VSRWTCPRCDREFANVHQSHVCVPAGTVDESFGGRPDWQRAIYDRLIEHVNDLGPVHIDAVGVGVFLKNDRKFAEVRPMVRALSLELMLPCLVDHPLVTRQVMMSAGRVWQTVRLRDPQEVDEGIRDMLTLAYESAERPG
jgi:hypothetical protein